MEYFFGARQWLVPGLVAAVLSLLNTIGLGTPQYYIGAVEIFFCGISLSIPIGMYFFARLHFSEASARLALVVGSVWYELVGFAHKPMTEFVSTGLVMILLALCIRPNPGQSQTVWAVALVGTLAAAVRFQYTPVVGIIMGIFFLRTRKKLQLVLISAGFVLAIGVFDGFSWGRGLFHSYLTNFKFNIAVSAGLADQSPPWQYLVWVVLASAGLSLITVVVAMATGSFRRYGFLLGLMALLLVLHSMSNHKEYRFIFAIIPLWLMIAADCCARINKIVPKVVAVLFSAMSLLGILNYLPYQHVLYRAHSNETGIVHFIRDNDPIFATYRYLSSEPDVSGIWLADRPYFNSGGYYFLHKKIPFYDSHSIIITAEEGASFPGYILTKQFDTIKILRRSDDATPVRTWRTYNPILVTETGGLEAVIKSFDSNALPAPQTLGIQFADDLD